MFKHLTVIAVTCVATTAFAQPPTVPRVPQSPPPAAVWPTYPDALAYAKRTGTPLVVFVGVPARKIIGVVSASEPGLWRGETWVKKGILITTDGKHGRWFTPDTTDEQIREVVWPPRRVAPESIPRQTSRLAASAAVNC